MRNFANNRGVAKNLFNMIPLQDFTLSPAPIPSLGEVGKVNVLGEGFRTSINFKVGEEIVRS